MKFEDQKIYDGINYNHFDGGYFVPATISEELMLGTAESRIDGRFPTLSYINKKSGYAIWRSSELKSKAMGTEIADNDVSYLKELM